MIVTAFASGVKFFCKSALEHDRRECVPSRRQLHGSPRFNGRDADHWRSHAAGRAAQLNAATLARIARAPGLTTHALAVGTTLAA